MDELTHLINQIERGEPGAAAKLPQVIYEELRRLAAGQLRHESPGQTLQPTALVHEAYMRLVGNDPEKPWDGRAHFFAAAAEAMRRILIDNARKKRAIKRGGSLERIEMQMHDVEAVVSTSVSDDDLIALDDALNALEVADPETAQVVKLRYFAGMTNEQIARALGISDRSVSRRWVYARAWLRRQMKGCLD